ncbi:DNA-3-methyladenine glycosylase, partial [Trifolium medium]|nr:DNA-3-methyladenine glycosylase [Trifolium medium]
MKTPSLERKKSKSFKEGSFGIETSLSYSSSLITNSPGSIAAGRREQMALQQAQRKMKIAHYGRSKSAKFERVFPIDPSNVLDSKTNTEEEKRCSFITANSDPIYIAYHDEEWGVPVHDD